MKTSSSPELNEYAYLNEVAQLIESRRQELLLPTGLREDKHAAWPFKLLKLIGPLTTPSAIAPQPEPPKVKTNSRGKHGR